MFLLYCGEAKDKRIVLFHHNNHYDYIKSLPAFFNEKTFCFICFQPNQNDFFHKCSKVCKLCERKTCKEVVIKKLNNFKNPCLNDSCLLIHQENVCPKYVKCPICGRNQSKIHLCEDRWCLNCSKSVNMEHKLIIKDLNTKCNILILLNARRLAQKLQLIVNNKKTK
jgi:hypothetical protein